MLHYDQSAEVYDNQYCEEQKAKIESALKDFPLERESTVLDVGCGTGVLFPFVADRVKLTVGIDVSFSLLNQAKKRTKQYCNAALIRADSDSAPFPNETFDTVFAITLLQNTLKPSRTLDEMKRVTKQNSIIVATGLKKSFSRKEFIRLLTGAELEIKASKLDEELRDYVAVCSKSQKTTFKRTAKAL